MHDEPLHIVLLGHAIAGAAGNRFAAGYRDLVRELTRHGHAVTFLQRDRPERPRPRDEAEPAADVWRYRDLDDLRDRFRDLVRHADGVIVDSFVPEGATAGAWVVAAARGARCFLDLDTPLTLARLERGDHASLTPALIRHYDLYLSSIAGPTLALLERTYASPLAVTFRFAHPPAQDTEGWDEHAPRPRRCAAALVAHIHHARHRRAARAPLGGQAA